jgi:hypothetical protein
MAVPRRSVYLRSKFAGLRQARDRRAVNVQRSAAGNPIEYSIWTGGPITFTVEPHMIWLAMSASHAALLLIELPDN